MRPWKFQCWCGKSLISRIIRFRTWSHFSHVSITDGESVWEATTPKVRKLPLSQLVREQDGTCVAELCFNIPLTEVGEIAMINFMDSQVGYTYDYGDLFRFLLRDDQRNPDNRWICSEFAAAAALVGGQPLVKRIALYRVAPEQVFTSPTLFLLGYGLYNPNDNFRWLDRNIETDFREAVYNAK